MIIAGCDPGASGAIAFLDAETRRVLRCLDMPMAGAELLIRELVMDIDGALDGRKVGHLFIEKQTPFAAPGRSIGAASSFNLGQRYMAIRAIAACYGWPTEIVPPKKWQRHYGIARADKARSVALADELMPLDCDLWRTRRMACTRAQAIGRAEAALIGLYGVRMLAGIGDAVTQRAAEMVVSP